jgi:F0F1-type ATP synthase membrane subunit b/b'
MLIVSIIVLQIVIFLSLILLFRRILTRNIASATKHLDELNQEYDKKEKEAQRHLDEAKQKSQEIISKAADEAEKKREEIMKKAESERTEMLKAARTQSDDIMEQADKSRAALIAEIEERIAKEAVKKASELIQCALPEELKLATHAQWTKELIDKGFDKLGEVKVVEGTKEIKVITPFPLKDADKTRLERKVNEFLGKKMELKEELDPKVVAGIVVEIGSLVLDGSLRNKIMEESAALDAAKSRGER